MRGGPDAPTLAGMRTTAILVALALTACALDEHPSAPALDAGSDAETAADASHGDPPPLDATWTLGQGTRSGVISCWCPCSDGDGTPARECRGGEQETIDTFGEDWAAAVELAKGSDAGARCWCQCLGIPLEVLPVEPSKYPTCGADTGPRL